MQGEPRATTPCPRCAKPIVWRRRVIDRDIAMAEVVAWDCACDLADHEWTDLAEAAAESLDVSG